MSIIIAYRETKSLKLEIDSSVLKNWLDDNNISYRILGNLYNNDNVIGFAFNTIEDYIAVKIRWS